VAALAPDAVGVVGMSLGGLSSIALTAAAPELVRALVLVDVTPGVNPEKSAPITNFVNGPASFASFDELLARTMEHNPSRTEASLRRGILHNALQREDGSWVWRYARFRDMESGRAPEFGDWWSAISDGDRADDAGPGIGVVGRRRCRRSRAACGASPPARWSGSRGPATACKVTVRWSWPPSCRTSSSRRLGSVRS
jgi:pimeloyl-ACP methyl ester carboxylesterase